MPEANNAYTTPEEFFWSGYRKAEAEIVAQPEPAAEFQRGALITETERLSKQVWSDWKPTMGELKLMAELAAYWAGGRHDDDGDLQIANLDSKYCDRRAVAELIAAVMAFAKNGGRP